MVQLRFAALAIINGLSSRKLTVTVSRTSLTFSLVQLLYREGLLVDYRIISERVIQVTLGQRVQFIHSARWCGSRPVNFSRVGLRGAYSSPNLSIFSTSSGLKTAKEAALLGLGGRLVLEFKIL